MILGKPPGESYSGIRVLVDLSVSIKYTNTGHACQWPWRCCSILLLVAVGYGLPRCGWFGLGCWGSRAKALPSLQLCPTMVMPLAAHPLLEASSWDPFTLLEFSWKTLVLLSALTTSLDVVPLFGGIAVENLLPLPASQRFLSVPCIVTFKSCCLRGSLGLSFLRQ